MKDELTLTIRIHDPKEKENADKSTNWIVLQVPRDDAALPPAQFAEKWLLPSAEQLIQHHQN